ncbi:hypothetical protein SELMODRAFT_422474 [Selaginella moellendorffii]|uniref:Protein kinase domain-containing protein n=1 Tax=Selaginella moellendorffii TaxID=88036 RepID=D8SIH9_SELML|nr:hypothetical protein SELMODRAFT_422474 [Selaginella moellendorffii]
MKPLENKERDASSVFKENEGRELASSLSSHTGEIDRGRERFQFGIAQSVQHYLCLIDEPRLREGAVARMTILRGGSTIELNVTLHLNNLRKVVTEVDAYKTLHKLQGVQIPRLVSWGFLCGTMFAYVMTSDEGTPLTACPAHEALATIHARGVIHGDLSPLKILFGRGSCRSSSQSSWLRSFGLPPTSAPRRSMLLQGGRSLSFINV